MKKYYNRETAPLLWHKLTYIGSLIGSIGSAIASVAFLVSFIIPKQDSSSVVSTEFRPIYAIGCAALAVYKFFMYKWGRKFNRIFLIVTEIEIALSILLTIVVVMLLGANGQLLFDCVTSFISNILVLIYYMKRSPLFDPNYTGLEPGQGVEINYDQMNQQTTDNSQNQQ